MQSALRRGEHVALILDRASAQQQMPMRSAGRRGECGRSENECKLAHPAIELGKTQVVANRKADAAARQLCRDDVRARLDGLAFVVALVAAREGEEMNLVVTGNALPLRTVDEAGAAHARGIVARKRHGTADQPN